MLLLFGPWERLGLWFVNETNSNERSKFEEELDRVKEKENVKTDAEVSAEGLKSLIPVYKEIIKILLLFIELLIFISIKIK